VNNTATKKGSIMK